MRRRAAAGRLLRDAMSCFSRGFATRYERRCYAQRAPYAPRRDARHDAAMPILMPRRRRVEPLDAAAARRHESAMRRRMLRAMSTGEQRARLLLRRLSLSRHAVFRAVMMRDDAASVV